jgi:hypothetical protein
MAVMDSYTARVMGKVQPVTEYEGWVKKSEQKKDLILEGGTDQLGLGSLEFRVLRLGLFRTGMSGSASFQRVRKS